MAAGFFERVICCAPGCTNWLMSSRGEGTEIEIYCRKCRRIITIDPNGKAVSYRDVTRAPEAAPMGR